MVQLTDSLARLLPLALARMCRNQSTELVNSDLNQEMGRHLHLQAQGPEGCARLSPRSSPSDLNSAKLAFAPATLRVALWPPEVLPLAGYLAAPLFFFHCCHLLLLLQLQHALRSIYRIPPPTTGEDGN